MTTHQDNNRDRSLSPSNSSHGPASMRFFECRSLVISCLIPFLGPVDSIRLVTLYRSRDSAYHRIRCAHRISKLNLELTKDDDGDPEDPRMIWPYKLGNMGQSIIIRVNHLYQLDDPPQMGKFRCEYPGCEARPMEHFQHMWAHLSDFEAHRLPSISWNSSFDEFSTLYLSRIRACDAWDLYDFRRHTLGGLRSQNFQLELVGDDSRWMLQPAEPRRPMWTREHLEREERRQQRIILGHEERRQQGIIREEEARRPKRARDHLEQEERRQEEYIIREQEEQRIIQERQQRRRWGRDRRLNQERDQRWEAKDCRSHDHKGPRDREQKGPRDREQKGPRDREQEDPGHRERRQERGQDRTKQDGDRNRRERDRDWGAYEGNRRGQDSDRDRDRDRTKQDGDRDWRDRDRDWRDQGRNRRGRDRDWRDQDRNTRGRDRDWRDQEERTARSE